MVENDFIELEFPSISLNIKKQEIQNDKDLVVIDEYACYESVDAININEPTRPNPDFIGLDVTQECISAKITFSFKSKLKGGF